MIRPRSSVLVCALVGCSSATITGGKNLGQPPQLPSAADCTEPPPGSPPAGWVVVNIGTGYNPAVSPLPYGWWACSPTVVFSAGANGSVVRPLGPFDALEGSTGLTQVEAVWGASTKDIYAVGAGIAHFNGTSWTKQYQGAGLHAVWGIGSSDVYAVGENVVLHSTGNGQWTTVYTASFSARAVNGSASNDVWVVGSSTGGATSVILHGSATHGFAPDPSSTVFVPLASVWSAASSEAFAVGGGERVTYDGKNW